jgi:tryptophan synthase alpha chain
MTARGGLAGAFAAARGRTALIPFLTAGYPDLDTTLLMLARLERAGVLAVELGVPYSDPVADGPDIQRASEWALRRGVHLGGVLETAARFRRDHALPLVLMSYVNPVLRRGIERFTREAREAGVDAVLLTDLPADEAPEVWGALAAGGLDAVVLVAPTTGAGRLPGVVARARAFVYCLARTGVTGEGPGESGDLRARVAEIRRHTALPVAVGFGISRPEQARALAGVADAVVVGTAFMRAVAAEPAPAGCVETVGGMAEKLVAALRGGEGTHAPG